MAKRRNLGLTVGCSGSFSRSIGGSNTSPSSSCIGRLLAVLALGFAGVFFAKMMFASLDAERRSTPKKDA